MAGTLNAIAASRAKRQWASCRLQRGRSPELRHNAGAMKGELDDIDRRILGLLQADGRLTHVALAAQVGLSRSAVQERVARLEREGVIQGYTIRLGRRSAAPGLRAYLLLRGGPSHDRVARMLESFPEVKVADSVSGAIDPPSSVFSVLRTRMLPIWPELRTCVPPQAFKSKSEMSISRICPSRGGSLRTPISTSAGSTPKGPILRQ